MYTVGTGFIVLIFALLILGFMLGYAYGIAYTLRKIREKCLHQVYIHVMNALRGVKED